jgi:hypothetical protein
MSGSGRKDAAVVNLWRLWPVRLWLFCRRLWSRDKLTRAHYRNVFAAQHFPLLSTVVALAALAVAVAALIVATGG